MGHLLVVVVDRVEARLVLQAEDEDDGVYPGSELEERGRGQGLTYNIQSIIGYVVVVERFFAFFLTILSSPLLRTPNNTKNRLEPLLHLLVNH